MNKLERRNGRYFVLFITLNALALKTNIGCRQTLTVCDKNVARKI